MMSGVIADFNPAPGCGCPPIPGIGNFEKAGTGTLILSGTNTYTGTTAVNGGILQVDGSIASSILTTVNAGGALTGIGTVGNTTIAERRHLPAGQRHAGHVDDGRRQSRVPVRRAVPGPAQFDDVVVRQRDRHRRVERARRRLVCARQQSS